MKKDQFIIAYLPYTDKSDTVLSYARWLAAILSKGLILLHICDTKYSTLSPDEAEQRLKELQGKIKMNTGVTYAVLKGETSKVIDALPTLLNAVAIVAQVDAHARRGSALSRKDVLKNFSGCKTAFLVAQEPLHNTDKMKEVAMSLDFKKESKDKLIWSSYFPRFGSCRMNVLYYDYKDQFLKNKWYATMQQLHKLYSELGITFHPHIIKSKSTFTDVNALRYAAENGYGLLISVTTKERDGLEFFIGTQEQRTIVNKEHIPSLFLNPREDLYVLCD